VIFYNQLMTSLSLDFICMRVFYRLKLIFEDVRVHQKTGGAN